MRRSLMFSFLLLMPVFAQAASSGTTSADSAADSTTRTVSSATPSDAASNVMDATASGDEPNRLSAKTLPANTLSDADVTRYFVCSYLHTEDSYKIGSYLIKNYEMQWYTYNEKFKALVNARLSEISRTQSVSKFKAEDELSNKYQCNSAYIDLLGLSNIKI